MYRYSVLVEKHFVSGLMSGRLLTDLVKFATWQEANNYVQWASEHKKIPVEPCAGCSAYTIESAILEAI